MKRAWYLGVTADEVASRCIPRRRSGAGRALCGSARGGAPGESGARLTDRHRHLRWSPGYGQRLWYGGTDRRRRPGGAGRPRCAHRAASRNGHGGRRRCGSPRRLRAGAGRRAWGGDLGYLRPAPTYPAVADLLLLDRTRAALERSGARYREGLLASYDGFYTNCSRPTRGGRGRSRRGWPRSLGWGCWPPTWRPRRSWWPARCSGSGLARSVLSASIATAGRGWMMEHGARVRSGWWSWR